MQRDRKKVHKKIMKYIRKVNKQIAADEYIGLNRFRADMFSESWFRFNDGSGGILYMHIKLSDAVTGNTAFYIVEQWGFEWKLYEYLNDFMIRCSDGCIGHHPPLHYVAYDVHDVVPYDGRKDMEPRIEEDVIATYSWINGVSYDKT